MIRLIDRYLFREILSPFLMGIFLLTFLMVTHQLLQLTEWVMDKGVALLTVADLFLKLLPSFFVLTIPMAAAFAAILSFNRLAFDHELTALNASGIPFFRLLRPVFFFSVITFGLTFLMGTLSAQMEVSSFKSIAIKMLKEKVGVALDAGRFSEILPGLMIYTESMPGGTQMNRVFIYDGRSAEPQIISAKTGFLINNRAESREGNSKGVNKEAGVTTLGIRLQDGMLHTQNQERDRLITFGSYSLQVRTPSPTGGGEPSGITGVVTPDGPANTIVDPQTLLSFYKKYSLAYASFLFCFLGIPFGLYSGKTGRLGAFSGCLGLILCYYLLNMAGDYLFSSQGISPLLAALLPNLVLTPITILLLVFCTNSASVTPKRVTKAG